MKQIKMAQIVIVVIGADASEPAKAETMGWEVEQAVKYNRQIMIVNPAGYDMPAYLVRPGHFTKQNQPIAKQQTLRETKQRTDDFAKGYFNIFPLNTASRKRARRPPTRGSSRIDTRYSKRHPRIWRPEGNP